MDEIDKLKDSFLRHIGNASQAQIRFVECTAVDWISKTMDAVGTGDETEYLDVSLGYGFIDVKPKIGAICLIGIVEGLETISFLINASEVELVEIKSNNIVFNGGKNMGLVKIVELTEKLNGLAKTVNTLISQYNGHRHLINTVGTASAQSGTSLVTEAQASTAESFNKNDYEDLNITH